jgi:hypothetical protein
LFYELNLKYKNKHIGLFALSVTLGVVAGNTEVAFSDEGGYAPLGFHPGSFYIFPVVEIGIGYDDNVFRVPENTERTEAFVNGPESDTVVTARASVAANSDWNRHELRGMASIDLGKYSELSSEDFGNYAVDVDGKLDVKRGQYATGNAGFRKGTESRSSVDDRELDNFTDTPTVFGVEPTEFFETYVGAGYNYKPAKLGASADLDYRTIEYDDVTNIFGENVDNSDRNRSRTGARVRFGYEVMPQRSLYVEGAVNSVDYDRPVDNNGIERSSVGYKATAGMHFDLSNLLLGDIYVGYLEQNYDSPTQGDISGSVYGLGLQWYPSRLTSINLHLDRNVEESTEATASGYLSTTARIGVEHELKRNIILSANADYTENKFKQNLPGQKEREDITGFGLEGRYLISRRFYTSLRYRHEYRNSDIRLQEYTNNRGLLTLGVNW